MWQIECDALKAQTSWFWPSKKGNFDLLYLPALESGQRAVFSFFLQEGRIEYLLHGWREHPVIPDKSGTTEAPQPMALLNQKQCQCQSGSKANFTPQQSESNIYARFGACECGLHWTIARLAVSLCAPSRKQGFLSVNPCTGKRKKGRKSTLDPSDCPSHADECLSSYLLLFTWPAD